MARGAELNDAHALERLHNAIASKALVKRSDGAVIIDTEASGTRSAWLFDFRAIMLQPEWLDLYAELFWHKFEKQLPFQVCGMETAGISLVAAIVMKGVERGTPVNGFFIRKSRKRQGLMKQVEGTVTDDPVIIVDDLINSGGTLEKPLLVLTEAGKRVSDIFAILAFRDVSAYSKLAAHGARVDSLFSLPDFDIPFLATKSIDYAQYAELWRFIPQNPSLHLVVHKSSPALDDERVFFGTDDGVMYALEQKKGAILWQHRVGKHPEGKGILSSPAVFDGSVYFGAYDGVVYSLDAGTGAVQWTYDDADWVGSSPALAIDKELLFIGLEFGLWKKRGGIVALDMRTGKKRWSATMPALTHASPLYIKEESIVVIGCNDGYLRAYDAVSGEERWSTRTEGDIKMAPAYDPKRRLVCFCSMDGKLYAVSADDGVAVFAMLAGGGFYSGPTVFGDTVYAASLDKTLYAVDIETGTPRWTFSTNGRIFASPACHGDSVWVGSNDGKLYELDAETGALRGSFQVSERILTKPAFAQDGSIFFGTVANEIYHIQKKRDGA
jgi:outer membrane protein assembly factor BamB/orotate phosphoribosyltransferase